MKTFFSVKNYRCFVSPIKFEIRDGFTAFVGVNNAGKSALMRFFLEFRPPLIDLCNDQNAFERCFRGYGSLQPLGHVLDPEEVFSNLNAGPIDLVFEFESDPSDEVGFVRAVWKIEVLRNLTYQSTLAIDGFELPRGQYQGRNGNQLIVSGRGYEISPLLDSLRSLTRTLYIGPFRNTINVGTNTNYLDIQIGQAFIAQFRELKTGANKKNSSGISLLTDQIRKIFRFEALDISPTSDNSSLHLTVNGRPFKQHELGSGLAQFIIVLANAAIRTPDWVLIDEPELNLHPSLQLEFLTALASYAKRGVWFSTHSLGLARTAGERVFSVWKESEGDSKVKILEGTPRLPEFLGELSFSSQKELGFEKVLLVEGPTEVKVLQQFLRLINKDHKILLLPLHGHMPDAAELEEVMRVTTNVVALIDSEKESETSPLNKDRQDFIDLCASMNLTCHVLSHRAIENYFPDRIVKDCFGRQYRGLAPYEKLSAVTPHWSKSLNWKMAAVMRFSDLEETDLGVFLKGL